MLQQRQKVLAKAPSTRPKADIASPYARPLPKWWFEPVRCRVLSLGGGNETARVHHAFRRSDGCVAARSARAAIRKNATRRGTRDPVSAASVYGSAPIRNARLGLCRRPEYYIRVALRGRTVQPGG